MTIYPQYANFPSSPTCKYLLEWFFNILILIDFECNLHGEKLLFVNFRLIVIKILKIFALYVHESRTIQQRI